MPKPLNLPPEVKKVGKRWIRLCPACGASVSHLRRNYCINAFGIKQPCKKCSVKKNHPSGMVGAVRVAWFNSFYKSALSRGYQWNISIEEVDTLYSFQSGRCALTGWPIGWSSEGWNHTASIDRIDNSRGYDLNNIQLVHKSLNMARGSMTIDDFLEVCRAVADFNKVKW